MQIFLTIIITCALSYVNLSQYLTCIHANLCVHNVEMLRITITFAGDLKLCNLYLFRELFREYRVTTIHELVLLLIIC
jgi:hypothetical protein